MKILYWNTLLTTPAKPLYRHLMFLNHTLKLDYFCLSEVTPQLLSLFQAAGWQVFYKANTSQRGMLIASRKNLINKRSYLLSAAQRSGGDNANHLLLVDIKWRNQMYTLANTHLTYLRLREIVRRKTERKELVGCLPRNSTLLGGDFNAVIVPFVKWEIQNIGYVSHVRGKTWCWHLKNTLWRIPVKLQLDYIFTTKDMANLVTAYILSEQKLSDHSPLLVQLN